jgi:RimJ/RimL family protein N-acetyltransferase
MQLFYIETKELKIRQINLSDLDEFYFYRSNPEVTKYQSFDVMTFDQAKNFITENLKNSIETTGEWVQYGIENKTTKKLIGDCAIKIDRQINGIAEIGITISHQEQKKGYAKQVLIGILNFLYEKKSVRRVVEIVDEENIASINLLKSVGFRQEGHFIENIFIKGKWVNELYFAMLKREWDKKNNSL